MDALNKKDLMSVEDRVEKIIKELFNVNLDVIMPEASLVDDLGLDSIGIVELQIWLEDKFNIKIGDDKMDKMHTVKDVVEFVRLSRKLNVVG